MDLGIEGRVAIITGAKGDPLELSAAQLGVSFDGAVASFLDEERPGIALLVSARGSFINGANVRVDGGSVQSVQS